ncbi:MAG: serine/threonine-protein kinase, partial [bacterium]
MNAQDLGENAGEWSIGQTRLDDFVVERMLGEGGMGKVYLLKSKTTGMQFAVKRAKGLSDADRRNFLAELQTWIDLPEHPNLVPCRFFRTVADEVLIFAEYVQGGSLKDWIDSGKLYEGGKEKALERILDTATQFAWGLHCLHELGLVHQDVKPANVMMGSDAQVAVQGLKAMVADFGLARARATAGERYDAELGRSILVSSGGYTPAYCSPEQVSGGKLDRRTDLWSWGLSVLEMFQGEVTWHSGTVAAEALEAFLEHNGEEDHIPAMPVELADTLKNCFHQDPARRYQKLDVLVNWLPSLYLAKVGTEYRRNLDKIEERTTPQDGVWERRTKKGGTWTDPLEWLQRALKEDGRAPTEAADIVAHLASSRRGQLIADVATYDEARRIYERLVGNGHDRLKDDLALLYCNAAILHAATDDFSGACDLYDKAIEVLDRLYAADENAETGKLLVLIHNQKAALCVDHGDNGAGIASFDKAKYYKQVIEGKIKSKDIGRSENEGYSQYLNQGVAQANLGNHEAAIVLIKKELSILQRNTNAKYNAINEKGLALCYMNIANSQSNLGINRQAVDLYKRAIEIMEELVNRFGRKEHGDMLAKTYINLAVALKRQGDYTSAAVYFPKAIDLLEKLVYEDSSVEYLNTLASGYMNYGITISETGDINKALLYYEKALTIRERSVNIDGRHDLAPGLGLVYINLA